MAVIENRSGMYGLAVEHRKRGKAAIALSQTGGGLKSEWGPKLALRPSPVCHVVSASRSAGVPLWGHALQTNPGTTPENLSVGSPAGNSVLQAIPQRKVAIPFSAAFIAGTGVPTPLAQGT